MRPGANVTDCDTSTIGATFRLRRKHGLVEAVFVEPD